MTMATGVVNSIKLIFSSKLMVKYLYNYITVVARGAVKWENRSIVTNSVALCGRPEEEEEQRNDSEFIAPRAVTVCFR